MEALLDPFFWEDMLGQLLLGAYNGAFYAVLSLGLAVIFGLLNIINFTHGAQYMMGAFTAWGLLNGVSVPQLAIDQPWLAERLGWAWLAHVVVWPAFTLFPGGVGYWWALLLVPIVVGATGIVIERLMLKHLYKLDHLYGLLLTFGLALIIQGLFRNQFGVSGVNYARVPELAGTVDLGFMIMPTYRLWVIAISAVVCLGTWFVIERTRLGSYLRAGTENAALVQAFGINVPRMITLTFGFGVALAGFAGVLAAPTVQVAPLMGADLIIVVFAVVVIGGMGSIMGSILTGFGLGLLEGLTKFFYPEASNVVIFVVMAVVLLIRPAGLFGRAA